MLAFAGPSHDSSPSKLDTARDRAEWRSQVVADDSDHLFVKADGRALGLRADRGFDRQARELEARLDRGEIAVVERWLGIIAGHGDDSVDESADGERQCGDRAQPALSE